MGYSSRSPLTPPIIPPMVPPMALPIVPRNGESTREIIIAIIYFLFGCYLLSAILVTHRKCTLIRHFRIYRREHSGNLARTMRCYLIVSNLFSIFALAFFISSPILKIFLIDSYLILFSSQVLIFNSLN